MRWRWAEEFRRRDWTYISSGEVLAAQFLEDIEALGSDEKKMQFSGLLLVLQLLLVQYYYILFMS